MTKQAWVFRRKSDGFFAKPIRATLDTEFTDDLQAARVYTKQSTTAHHVRGQPRSLDGYEWVKVKLVLDVED